MLLTPRLKNEVYKCTVFVIFILAKTAWKAGDHWNERVRAWRKAILCQKTMRHCNCRATGPRWQVSWVECKWGGIPESSPSMVAPCTFNWKPTYCPQKLGHEVPGVSVWQGSAYWIPLSNFKFQKNVLQTITQYLDNVMLSLSILPLPPDPVSRVYVQDPRSEALVTNSDCVVLHEKKIPQNWK